MSRIPRRTARVTTALAATAGVLALSSCSWISPQTTLKSYDASDGISGNVGDIDIRNIMVISVGKDQPGQVIAYADNTGTSQATVKIEHADSGDAGSSIEVPAQKSVKIDPQGGSNVKLNRAGANPGETVNLKVSVGADTETLAVPVLDGTLPEYAALIPAGSNAGPGVTQPTAGVLETEAAAKYLEENPPASEHGH